MVHKEDEYVKLDRNEALAWFQCHPRASVYLFFIGLANIGLNLLDLVL